MTRSIALLFAAVSATALAQTAPPSCTGPEHRQFDFWVGTWVARWQDPSGKPAQGRNRIENTLDGCAVVEHFDGAPGTPLKGLSVSTYDRASGQWKQVWVDNSGGWLDFTGGFADGRMVLGRRTTQQGKPVLQRMVFRDITPQAFTWDWQVSSDDGATWATRWQIDYTRAAP